MNTEISQCDWENFKCMKKKYKIPAWNNSGERDIFYLGKSTTIQKRLIEHIERCSETTYSLKLYLYDEILEEGKTLDYMIYVYLSNSGYEYDILNGIIEARLHDLLKPQIGNK